MPNYRRSYVPGGTFFLTIVTYERQPLLSGPAAIESLRHALRQVMAEAPFRITAAVILPDHVHFLWALPRGDAGFSRRVGRMKVLFTRASGDRQIATSDSRRKHRESSVWHRRFWEHAIEDENDFERHLDYIHYNPVKHGLASCPHLWPHSSFASWVRTGWYDRGWGCRCAGRIPVLPELTARDEGFGE